MAGGQLPGGQVIVAGGRHDGDYGFNTMLAAAELWDPNQDTWTPLPAMKRERGDAAACVLPGGRFAIVGYDGWSDNVDRGEIFDCMRRVWTPITASHEGCLSDCLKTAALVPVAGGMLRGSEALLDEESGQWLKLPTRTTNSMRTAGHTRAVLLPATLAQSTALAANH
jgi:hypothetical protein